MWIVRGRLSAKDVMPNGLRYDDDCECVQQNVGGEWVANPQADPRQSLGSQYPAPVTDDPACDAAERIKQALRESIGAITNANTVLEAANSVLGIIIVFLPEIALFWALLTALAVAANAIGFAAVSLAFTDEVYDDIKCLVDCAIGSDGQFSDTEWDAFQDDLGAFFGVGTVTAILSLFCGVMGRVGFNNAAAVRTETGDCEDCGCFWNFTLPLTVDGYPQYEQPHFFIEYVNSAFIDGSGIAHGVSVGSMWAILHFTNLAGDEATYRIDFARLTCTEGGSNQGALTLSNAGGDIVGVNPHPGTSVMEVTNPGSLSSAFITMYQDVLSGTYEGFATELYMEGQGKNPFS